MGQFIFHRHTYLLLPRLICCIIRKYLSHILFRSHFVSVWLAMEFFFFFKIYCLQMLQLFQTRDGPFLFHLHTCLHLSRFIFAFFSRKYISYILFWSHFVWVWLAMELLFSFKIHCLQMLQLFPTSDGPFFHRHTCRAFFCCIINHIYSIYCSLFHNETLFLL